MHNKNLYRYILLISFLLLVTIPLINCDPADTRMKFQNNTSKDVFIRMIFIGNDNKVKETWVSLRKIEKDTIKTIDIIYNWEGEFKDGIDIAQDSTLDVIVYKNYEFFNIKDVFHPKYPNEKRYRADSLLKIGEYEIRSYTYDELKKKNWLIVYPDDGFKQGWPLNPEK